jgi:hypothetical protein
VCGCVTVLHSNNNVGDSVLYQNGEYCLNGDAVQDLQHVATSGEAPHHVTQVS